MKKWKRCKIYVPYKHQNKTGVVILIENKVVFRTRKFLKDKEDIT